jgi:hypothetical protein
MKDDMRSVSLAAVANHFDVGGGASYQSLSAPSGDSEVEYAVTGIKRLIEAVKVREVHYYEFDRHLKKLNRQNVFPPVHLLRNVASAFAEHVTGGH